LATGKETGTVSAWTGTENRHDSSACVRDPPISGCLLGDPRTGPKQAGTRRNGAPASAEARFCKGKTHVPRNQKN